MWLFEDSRRQFERKKKREKPERQQWFRHVYTATGQPSVMGKSVDGFGCCNAIPTGEFAE